MVVEVQVVNGEGRECLQEKYNDVDHDEEVDSRRLPHRRVAARSWGQGGRSTKPRMGGTGEGMGDGRVLLGRVEDRRTRQPTRVFGSGLGADSLRGLDDYGSLGPEPLQRGGWESEWVGRLALTDHAALHCRLRSKRPAETKCRSSPEPHRRCDEA